MQAPSSITRVENYEFKMASEDDQHAFASGYVERTKRAAASLTNSALLWKSGGDLYQFFGKKPSGDAPWTLVETNLGWNWVLFSNPTMFKGISMKYRHTADGDFANDMVAKTFLKIGSELFGVTLQPDDTITTCTPEQNKIYRTMAARHLGAVVT